MKRYSILHLLMFAKLAKNFRLRVYILLVTGQDEGTWKEVSHNGALTSIVSEKNG